MIKIILLLSILFSFPVFAKVDFKADIIGRSYPIGMALMPEVGYAKAIWQKDKIKYGYIRSSLNAKISGLVNYSSVNIEVFPISFFGISFGKFYGVRNLKNVQNFDCSVIKCDGVLKKTNIKIQFAIAYKNFSFLNIFNSQQLSFQNENFHFVEESSSLPGISNDKLSTNTSFLNYSLNEKWSLGFARIFNKMKNTNQHTTLNISTVSMKLERWDIILGVGNFKTYQSVNHLSSLLLLKWKGSKGLRLF